MFCLPKRHLSRFCTVMQHYTMRNILMETIQQGNYSSLFIIAFPVLTWAKCAGIKAVKHHPPEDTHGGDYLQVTNSSVVPISVGIHTETLCKQSQSTWGIIFPMPVARCHVTLLQLGTASCRHLVPELLFQLPWSRSLPKVEVSVPSSSLWCIYTVDNQT